MRQHMDSPKKKVPRTLSTGCGISLRCRKIINVHRRHGRLVTPMAVADEYCMRANEIDPVGRQVVDWTTTTLCDRRTKRNQSGEAGVIVFVDMRLDRCTWSENNRKDHAGSIIVVETRRRTFKLMCGVPNLFAWHRDRDSLALARPTRSSRVATFAITHGKTKGDQRERQSDDGMATRSRHAKTVLSSIVSSSQVLNPHRSGPESYRSISIVNYNAPPLTTTQALRALTPPSHTFLHLSLLVLHHTTPIDSFPLSIPLNQPLRTIQEMSVPQEPSRG